MPTKILHYRSAEKWEVEVQTVGRREACWKQNESYLAGWSKNIRWVLLVLIRIIYDAIQIRNHLGEPSETDEGWPP